MQTRGHHATQFCVFERCLRLFRKTHSLTHPHPHSHSLTHSLTHSLNRPRTHSRTHALSHVFSTHLILCLFAKRGWLERCPAMARPWHGHGSTCHASCHAMAMPLPCQCLALTITWQWYGNGLPCPYHHMAAVWQCIAKALPTHLGTYINYCILNKRKKRKKNATTQKSKIKNRKIIQAIITFPNPHRHPQPSKYILYIMLLCFIGVLHSVNTFLICDLQLVFVFAWLDYYLRIYHATSTCVLQSVRPPPCVGIGYGAFARRCGRKCWAPKGSVIMNMRHPGFAVQKLILSMREACRSLYHAYDYCQDQPRTMQPNKEREINNHQTYKHLELHKKRRSETKQHTTKHIYYTRKNNANAGASCDAILRF